MEKSGNPAPLPPLDAVVRLNPEAKATIAQLRDQYVAAHRRPEPFTELVAGLAAVFRAHGLAVTTRKDDDDRASPFVSVVGAILQTVPADVYRRPQSLGALSMACWRALRAMSGQTCTVTAEASIATMEPMSMPAAASAAPEPISPIDETRWNRATESDWLNVSVPEGCTVEDLIEPSLWEAVAHKMKANRRMAVHWDDASQVAEVFVHEVGPNWARVQILTHSVFKPEAVQLHLPGITQWPVVKTVMLPPAHDTAT